MRLLKKGGVLVYSTCTVTLEENEEQVAWALKTFPCLTLQPQVSGASPRSGRAQKDVGPHCVTTTPARPQEPHVGAGGMLGAGLAPEQLHLLQRFSPELSWDQSGSADALHSRVDTDTIGFFIAKFLKN